MVEQLLCKERVLGSNPRLSTHDVKQIRCVVGYSKWQRRDLTTAHLVWWLICCYEHNLPHIMHLVFVAQWKERPPPKGKVAGSTPAEDTGGCAKR